MDTLYAEQLHERKGDCFHWESAFQVIWIRMGWEQAQILAKTDIKMTYVKCFE